MNGSEDPEKHLLREIERFFPIPEQIRRELHDGPLVLGDQFLRRRLIARGAALHERGLAVANIRPTCNARLLHPELPRWRCQ